MNLSPHNVANHPTVTIKCLVILVVKASLALIHLLTVKNLRTKPQYH